MDFFVGHLTPMRGDLKFAEVPQTISMLTAQARIMTHTLSIGLIDLFCVSADVVKELFDAAVA